MKEAKTEKLVSQKKTSTERVAEFISSTKFEDIPAGAVLVAKSALLDWIGVSIAGSQQPGAQILAEYAKKSAARNEASIICHGFKTTAEFAAWANGNIGHSIDFDDTNPAVAHYNMHPSTCVMPAVLAVAEKHKVSGPQMLTAYVVGMEVIFRVGAVIGAESSKSGWHPTPVIGSVATAAACANLLGLNQIQTQNALGIAASLAGGLSHNFGSMTKPLHAGNAARNGVVAAELAADGFTSNPNVFDGKFSYCQMFGGKPVNGLLGEENDLGKEWRLFTQGIGFKYYPSCRSTHTSIDATLELRKKYKITIDQVAEITCKINPHHLNMAKFLKPESGYQGKFSIPYCIITALRNGMVTLGDFVDAKVLDKKTQELLSLVNFVPDGGTDGTVLLAAEITIRLKNGEKHSQRVALPKGEPENPVTNEELASKFEDCSSLILNKKEISRLLKLVNSIEKAEDLTLLFDIIVKSPKVG